MSPIYVLLKVLAQSLINPLKLVSVFFIFISHIKYLFVALKSLVYNPHLWLRSRESLHGKAIKKMNLKMKDMGNRGVKAKLLFRLCQIKSSLVLMEKTEL